MNSQIERVGHAYYDVYTGKLIDAYFPEDGKYLERSCLICQLGVIRGEKITVTINDIQEPPKTAEECYLRLHLLSERHFKPNQQNLDGIFNLLNNVVFSSIGPFLPESTHAVKRALSEQAYPTHFNIFSIDKFPRMVDYVVPQGVRIGDADRVRLGAHLAQGTTVMHEGFVNFNAGSIGPVMIEGRVTPGVIVDEHSDIGAGSSIMGTLSGGGKQINKIGKRALLGANAGIGISLGDDSIVEAGLYVTAGTKVKMPNGTIVKAKDLSGVPSLVFRRNSQSGQVEVIKSDNTDWGGAE